jgi:glycosyltransferase involved in cell wall biosynthesis
MSDYSDLRILATRLDDGGCGNYRIKAPLTILGRHGARTLVVDAWHPKFVQWMPANLEEYTHILCQREHRPGLLERLLALRGEGASLVYEVDDNLHKVHPSSHAFQFFRPGSETVRNLDTFIRHTDGMIVTTADLAGQYGHLHNNIRVIPNYIDFSLRDWDTPVKRHSMLEGKIVVGWAGSHTHQDDYAPLQQVLREVLLQHDNVIFAICSSRPMMAQFIRGCQIPVERICALDPVPFAHYPAILAQFDIGLAPLKDTEFNRAKSDLKLKEYLARGVPYVATDIAAYRRFHLATGGVGGYLCRSISDWENALQTLIRDHEEREVRSAGGHGIVRQAFSMEDNIGEWATALRACRPGVTSIWSPSEKPGRNNPCPCGSGRKYKKCCTPAFG